MPFQRLDALGIVDRVHLVGDDDLRLRRHRRREALQLVEDGVEVLDRIASRRAGHVDQVHEHLRPLDVAKELVAEAVAFVRALDQPGTSATTKLRSSLSVTTPRLGTSVVNG